MEAHSLASVKMISWRALTVRACSSYLDSWPSDEWLDLQQSQQPGHLGHFGQSEHLQRRHAHRALHQSKLSASETLPPLSKTLSILVPSTWLQHRKLESGHACFEQNEIKAEFCGDLLIEHLHDLILDAQIVHVN